MTHINLRKGNLIAALMCAAIFLFTGCSSPGQAVDEFMLDVISGDYASASRHALPEITSAFRDASLVAGDGAPSEQGVATPELRRFLDACTVVTVERRMDSWAVVRWQPLTEELSDMARAYATSERELEYIDALPYGPFRFLVLKRKGRWLAGGMLPSKPDNSNTGLIIVD